ncbi:Enoyl-CoA hydratase [Pseudonocardia sp. Ae406_Ps2]|uniref:hypothetical protein n=1 Tax=unclassified Pseudonocardia TaxID=2619320 RepID=UPI0002DA0C4E|nr:MULTISPECIES: hypothetical protein [unclassified Pseudonocardia]KAA1030419.1 hypothetical protein FVA95_09930 [Pseudonocardia sp. EV170527-09]OLL96875.1 Enoyl-CoA hydratase [Pseudonocardia sp. Ae331_Ps2]OLM05414.1 Enoyl-CoA hydratase [Pseudonocardia sp. Ae406_Ps2]OLM15638.1 Enoyl-CoA hydratase [Pseudonocardia sp. Ae505_Ps2]OLM26984.1 Enoyl-CoA hydratase [Pseudonocardia sp. Ae706_Ps2]
MEIRPDIVGNEFAEVAVRIDDEANSRRLRIEDLRTGRVRYLDALELETLVWLPEGHLHKLLDPSADRWREDA